MDFNRSSDEKRLKKIKEDLRERENLSTKFTKRKTF